MREAIGGTWFFQLIIIFILLFVAYLALSINYSKAFRVKNEIISFIEREEGMTDRTHPDSGGIQLINSYLENAGYGTKGKCDFDPSKNWMGSSSLDSNMNTLVKIDESNENQEYFYCVNKVSTAWNPNGTKVKIAYYEVRVFFKFDLPMLGDLLTFKIEGKTDEVRNPADASVWR